MASFSATDMCMTRSTKSSLFFDFAVATMNSWLDEMIQLRQNGDDVGGGHSIPNKPTWFYYNFRMMTQFAVLAYNFARLIYEAYNSQHGIAVLSTVRCACLVGILARHYFICNFRWRMLTEGKMGHMVKLQIFFMFSYSFIGAIAGGIDPYFASDPALVIVFFLVPLPLRGVSFFLANVYAKLFTRVVDGITVEASFSPLLIFNVLTSSFYFAVFAAKPTSIFWADRLLLGIICFIPLLPGVAGAFTRDQISNQIRQKHVSSRVNNDDSNAVVPVDDDGDNEVGADLGKMGESAVGSPPPQPTPTTEDPTPDSRRVSLSTTGAQLIDHLERGKAFTEAKIFTLLNPVACTFMVLHAAELALSMGIYQHTGKPANWCELFSFADLDRGFQVVLDFFI